MKIYLSGKITGLTEDEREKNFNKAQLDTIMYLLKKNDNIYKGEHYINPLHIKPLFGIKKWLFHMIADIRELKKCDAISFQTNWLNSKGAVVEYFFSKFIFNHEIIFLKPCQYQNLQAI